MISKKEFLDIVVAKSRIFIPVTEDIWNLSITEQLGLDSILVIEMLVEIEKKYHVKFSFEKLKKIDVKSLSDLWDVICIDKHN